MAEQLHCSQLSLIPFLINFCTSLILVYSSYLVKYINLYQLASTTTTTNKQIDFRKWTLLLFFSSLAPSSLVEDAFVSRPDASAVSRSASDFDKLLDEVLDTPRFNGVYLLLVDMFCWDCFSDIGGGQLGRASVRPVTSSYYGCVSDDLWIALITRLN